MEQPVTNVLIVGVGGQGIILASEILCEVALRARYSVKKSEVHGMSQRGGVVTSQVRFGEKIYSPLIPEGEADIVLAFEEAEALRWAGWLGPQGTVIVNRLRLVPPGSFVTKTPYPDNVLETLQAKIPRVIGVDAVKLAQELGNPRMGNVLLLGVLSRFTPMSEDLWLQAVGQRVPKGTEQINLEAFARGRLLSEPKSAKQTRPASCSS
ncbi:MAG TPA: indolepyruvate oxidoreductase subunit beta [bacterium]|nr:indolepyruvate oxidoreductase subunit beta [bacterium]